MRDVNALGRRLRSLLLAALAISAILLGIVGMHASMVSAGHDMSHMSAPNGTSEAAAAPAVADGDLMTGPHGMGDMSGMDCLILGLMCFLTTIALIVGLVRIAALRALLRPRAAAQSLRALMTRLRPPVPPSLHVLSISRT